MDTFRSLFGQPPAVSADAPGRINLIGEHTDYNGGYVLPAPIPHRTRVELAPRAGSTVRAASASRAGTIAEYMLGHEERGREWLDYLQGLTCILRKDGHVLRGFDVRIESDIPLGSGLSSSAALEVSVLRALRGAFTLPLDDLELALIAQRAEHDFVGAHVGVMDQLAVSLGEEGNALFIDTQDLAHRHVPLPGGADIAVIDSGVSHRHAGGTYNLRRSECEQACTLLGVSRLRELGRADLPRVAALPEPLARRARHVISENARVLEAVAAIEAADLRRLGELLYDSHRSLRDDYEVSVVELDLLVELAREDGDVLGARLTGGGFGGSVVLLVRAGEGRASATRIARRYAARSGREALVRLPVPG